MNEALPDDAQKVGTVGPCEKWETEHWSYLVWPGTRDVINVARKEEPPRWN